MSRLNDASDGARDCVLRPQNVDLVKMTLITTFLPEFGHCGVVRVDILNELSQAGPQTPSYCFPKTLVLGPGGLNAGSTKTAR